MILVIILAIIGASVGVYFAVRAYLYNSAEEPVFKLPVNNVLNVTGIQTFHEEHGGTVHGGFDFKLENDTTIYSPIDGTITDIHTNQMDNDYWLVDVIITFNTRWYTFIAFEPWTQDEEVINEQLEKISVKVGDKVEAGDRIGTLTPVKDSEFPHIHWNVCENDITGASSTDRSPYDYCSDKAQDDLDYLCEKFDKPASYD